MEDSFNNGNKNNIIYNTEFFMYIKKMIEKAQRKKNGNNYGKKNILKFLKIK
jgi:hypothetical protein